MVVIAVESIYKTHDILVYVCQSVCSIELIDVVGYRLNFVADTGGRPYRNSHRR